MVRPFICERLTRQTPAARRPALTEHSSTFFFAGSAVHWRTTLWKRRTWEANLFLWCWWFCWEGKKLIYAKRDFVLVEGSSVLRCTRSKVDNLRVSIARICAYGLYGHIWAKVSESEFLEESLKYNYVTCKSECGMVPVFQIHPIRSQYFLILSELWLHYQLLGPSL